MCAVGGSGRIWKSRRLAWLLGGVAATTGGVAWAATGQGWATVVLAALGVFLSVADLLIGGGRAEADDLDLGAIALTGSPSESASCGHLRLIVVASPGRHY